MSFERNDYLAWYLPRILAGPEIDLSSSGVEPLELADIEVPEVDPWVVAREFERALADWLSIPPAELLFTPGATGGTLLALLTLAAHGDELLVEAPIYEPMLRHARRLGSAVERFERTPARNWGIDLDQVARKITRRTAAILVTEPSNPSGTFLPREQVLALAETAARHGAFLLVNEVYRGFANTPSFHGAAENIVVASSLSKLMGAYWARLGWLSAGEETIERLRRAHMNLSMQSSPSAAVGLGLMARAREWRERAVRISAVGLGIMDDWIAATPGLSWTRPEGPGFGCIRLPNHIRDDVRFAEALHEERGVLAVPGTYFEVPGFLRVSWLRSGDLLEEGLTRLTRML